MLAATRSIAEMTSLPFGGGELALEPEPSFVLEPPPAERSLPVRLAVDLDLGVGIAFGPSSDRTARHALGPRDQPTFAVLTGEAGELDDLVQTELAGGQGLRQPREVLQHVRGPDPPVRFPQRHPVAHREPVGEVPRSLVAPRRRMRHRTDATKQLTVCGADAGVRPVEIGDSARSIEHVFDPTPWRSTVL
jgi:hypothetical protein